MATPQEIATALKYGPQTGKMVRRSAQLEDLLKQNTQPEQPIRSPAELAARLVATALLSRSSRKADEATIGAIRADQGAETDSILAGLRPPQAATPAPTPQIAAQSPPALAPPIQAPKAAAPVQQAPQPQPAALQVAPQDRDALIRMAATEAGGEGPQGMAAAAHVALNRLKTGYGGAKSIAEVVHAPHQFEGMSRAAQVRPEDYQRASQVVDAVLGGQAPDPTGGAINFLNPELQTQLGRQIPAWAQGQGRRIGNHVFFGGQGAAPQQMAQNALPPPQEPPGGEMPDLSQAGMGEQPFQTPAPQASPPAAGAPPVASPQAAAGGNPPGISPEQIALAEKLLMNPRTHEVGVAYAMELQKKAAEPTKYDVKVQDGYSVATDPMHPERRMVSKIDELQTRPLTDQQAAQFHQPPGTVVQQKADGTLVFQRPDGGQMVASQPGQPYREAPIPGGQNDPYRTPAPQGGYGYASGGGQAPIQGGPADIRNPASLMQAAGQQYERLKTTVDSAMKVKQNFGAVQTGFRQKNGTGDIAMVNGIQKLIDEGVVKGEDVNMQMKSNGLQGTLGSWSQYANSGGLFTDDVRQKVYKTAADLYQNLDKTYRARVMGQQPGFDAAYGDGTFAKHVLPPAFTDEMGWTANGKPAEPAPTPKAEVPAAVNATWKALSAAGKIDPKKPYGDAANPMWARDAEAVRRFDVPANKGKHLILPDGSIAVID
jgi:spore germination cell wall hydrolase CwlJ-like protein